MSQSLSAVYIHAVFSTKERWQYLRELLVRDEVHTFLGGASNHLGCPALAVGGTGDHIHQLIRFSRTITQADWIKEIKRVSNAWAKQRYPHLHNFSWQAGYGMFSVNPSELDALRHYIATQEEHHRKASFQDEFRALLKQYGLEWDERYVWD
jgi:putative transposase